MSLERVNEERSEELSLPVGSILLSQMEYVIDVLMKFEPSLQLKTRATPGHQESFLSTAARPSNDYASQEYLQSLHALAVDDIVEADKVKKSSPKLHYNTDQVPINLPAIVGCLNWTALRTRPDIAWATSRAASLITHDPDLCFTRVKHICQYLHHTLGCALRYVPMRATLRTIHILHLLWHGPLPIELEGCNMEGVKHTLEFVDLDQAALELLRETAILRMSVCAESLVPEEESIERFCLEIEYSEHFQVWSQQFGSARTAQFYTCWLLSVTSSQTFPSC